MYTGGNTYNASNDLPAAKETNVDNAGNNSVNDINPSIASSMKNFLKLQQEAKTYAVEQIMGFHALKMLDSRIAAKKEIINRSKRAMIRARAKNGGNE